jgi:hypothetical protein
VEKHLFKERTLILNTEMFKKPSGPDDAGGEWRITIIMNLAAAIWALK